MVFSKDLVANQTVGNHRLSLNQIKGLEILKMTGLELGDYIYHCVYENPILANDSFDSGGEIHDEKMTIDILDSKAKELSGCDRESLLRLKSLLDIQLSSSSRVVSMSDSNFKEGGRDEGFYEDSDPIDWIRLQIKITSSDDDTKAGAIKLTDYLDTDGFLHIDERIFKEFRSKEDFENSLKLLQGQEPIGIGSTDLREFLLIQYSDMSRKTLGDKKLKVCDEVFTRVLDVFLLGSSLKSGFSGYRKLKEEFGVDQVERALSLLKAMKLKPLSDVGGNMVEKNYIIPDFIVEVDQKTGIVKGSLTSFSSPSLKINTEQLRLINPEGSQELNDFIFEQIKKSIMTFKVLTDRRKTMIEFIDCLVEAQKDYFLGGINNLKRIRQSDMGSILGINQSTVSRIIANKYISTPFGTFELSFFFSGGKKELIIKKN